MSRDVAWARTVPARLARNMALVGVLGPLMDVYAKRSVRGVEHLDTVEAPVLFVANHSSHMDTPAILHALPRGWRDRTAVAAAADYFYEKRLKAMAVSALFNTVPVARKGGEDATADLVRLLEDGWSLVIFAEGTRSRDGSVGKLHTGAAVLAVHHGLTIVPVHVAGTHETMPVGRTWPRRTPAGRSAVTVSFGPPVVPGDGEHRTAIMDRVRQFYESCGAQTTLDKRILSKLNK